MKKALITLLLLVALFTALNASHAEEIQTVDLQGGSEYNQSSVISVQDYGKYIHFKSISSLGGVSKGDQWFKLVAPSDGTYFITYKAIHKDFGGGALDTLLLGVYSNALGGWADPNGLPITDDRKTISTEVKKGEEVIVEFVDSVFLDRIVELTICFDGYHMKKSCNRTVRFADCEHDGVVVLEECFVCGAALRTEKVPALGHDMDPELKTIKEPTCMETGLEGYSCTRCGEFIETHETNPLGHTEGEEHVVREATCLEKGLIEYRCARCNEVLSSDTTPVIDHVPGKYESYKQATCSSEGLQAQYCIYCGELLKTSPIPALGHTAGKWETVREATDAEEGLAEQHCKDCGEILQTRAILPVGAVD